jgi:tight adherence protein B
MQFGDDLTTYALIAMIGLAVGGVILAIIYPWLVGSASASRVKSISGPKKENSGRSKLLEDVKDNRRKQVQESLNKVGETAKKRKRLSLKVRLNQAGLEISPRTFHLISIAVGVVLALGALIAGVPLYSVPLIAFAAAFGLPRWVLNYLGRRRQNKFLNDFADAIDVMVRGLKSGLPVTEAMRIIATEQGPPVGPEFMEVVEGQKIGIPVDQGIERMVERVPLPEVNFLAIVMTIQSKTGGNLSEALGNLSRVLRDRKKMKAKVQAVSQEAKSSAFIIGGMPFVIAGLLSFSNPTYLMPLFHTRTGNELLFASAIWMTMGALVMKKMINFKV